MDDQNQLMNNDVPVVATSPFLPSNPEKRLRFEEAMSIVLPQMGSHKGKLICAQVLIALKIEGILDKELTDAEVKMVQTIKDSVLADPEREKQALTYAKYKQIQGDHESYEQL